MIDQAKNGSMLRQMIAHYLTVTMHNTRDMLSNIPTFHIDTVDTAHPENSVNTDMKMLRLIKIKMRRTRSLEHSKFIYICAVAFC